MPVEPGRPCCTTASSTSSARASPSSSLHESTEETGLRDLWWRRSPSKLAILGFLQGRKIFRDWAVVLQWFQIVVGTVGFIGLASLCTTSGVEATVVGSFLVFVSFHVLVLMILTRPSVEAGFIPTRSLPLTGDGGTDNMK